uniref:N-acetyltransferase domain-containing protein n=1 Tax=viral metagenome TaxID=1070528 RepID=A0A6C0AXA2_9ZZZZ|tara:strand:+ start:29082 stop:30659 length:1578 start_codon:yes stop_codon:yes gene_type:complete
MIPYNCPYYHDSCIKNIKLTYKYGIQAGDGSFSKKCENILIEKYNFKKPLLVTSCTHALEMMAMLLNIKEGDEIIIPSYTFVSTASAFVQFGATIVCVDSKEDDPNIDPNEIIKNITQNTKAICIVHYAGWACDMDQIVKICEDNNIILLEDAAQAINSYYKNKPLGTFGAMSAFSFHETKNINCGEGGLLVINDDKYINRAEIIREKGTNRTSFFKGELSKYEWVDKGSSYLLSDILAAYLYPQLQDIDTIISYRKELWKIYHINMKKLESYNYFKVCYEHNDCIGNYHIFYLLFNSCDKLKEIKNLLKLNDILSTTHYVPLHISKYYKTHFGEISLLNSENFGKNILRLPLYNSLTIEYCNDICNVITSYIKHNFFHIKHSQLNYEYLDMIIKLKSQFWNFSKDSQLKWINKNVNKNDIHILLFEKEKLIGYGLIMKKNCNIVDSIIIDQNYKSKGYGGKLIQYITNYIQYSGFLLCEEKNISFYEKYGWLQNNNLEIIGKDVRDNLYKMSYKLIQNNIMYNI